MKNNPFNLSQDIPTNSKIVGASTAIPIDKKQEKREIKMLIGYANREIKEWSEFIKMLEKKLK